MSSGTSSRSLSRVEVAVLLGISITGHTALAVKVARTRPDAPRVVAQTVSIEMEPPVVEPPKVPPPEPERPKQRPAVAERHPAPRPHFDAPPPVEEPPATDEAEAPPPAVAPPPADVGLPGPPAQEPAPAKPAPVIAAHEGANYLKNPRPAYPELALRREWQGEVLLRVRVSPDGRAVGITVERSSGRDVLDEAAQEAVKGWSFVPSRQGGVAIAGWVTVPIVFRLQQGE